MSRHSCQNEHFSRLRMLADRLGTKTLKELNPKSEICKDRGSVMLEMALLLPLLLLFSLNTFDIGRLLINYMDAVHIVREGVRIGGTTIGLEPGSYEHYMGNCTDLSTATACSANIIKQRQLQQYISQIIATSSNDFNVDPADIKIVTQYDAGVNSVTVRLNFKYHGLFQPFDLINVTTSAVGPFL